MRAAMTESTLGSLILALACVLLPLCAAQSSCRGRCGEPFTRGQVCNCDYSCFIHGECCKDFEEVCTTSGSCRGRCGEPFRRGRQCDCDSDCVSHNNCCPDYHGQCGTFSNLQGARSANKPTVPPKTKTTKMSDLKSLRVPKKPSESESEEAGKVYTEDQCIAACLANLQGPNPMGDGTSALANLNNFMAPSEAPLIIAGAPLTQDSSLFAPLNPSDIPVMDSLSGFPLPQSGPAPVPGPVPVPAEGPSAGKPLTIPVQISLSINGKADGPSSGPAPGSGRPSTLADITQALAASSPVEPDANSNPDLCSNLPINGIASLFNGTIIVFKGHFFWLLNPKTRAPGPARRITEELGIPSPIDTAFTRCNCQGKTYIIKGDNYWVFENGVMEAGYPRSVSQDFGGLTGEITAALPIPATRKRPEAVFFFKRGGTVQKFSYPPGSAPSCSGKKVKNSVYAKIRRARQAEIQLSGEININLNWKGFPTPVTSALTMPNSRKPDGFEYLVFSWPKVFNIKISSDLPTLAAPASSPSQQNEIRNWLNCP